MTQIIHLKVEPLKHPWFYFCALLHYHRTYQYYATLVAEEKARLNKDNFVRIQKRHGNIIIITDLLPEKKLG